MLRSGLILAAITSLSTLAWADEARADEPEKAPPATSGEHRVQLDNGDWVTIDETEIINVFAERAQKPVNRDTELRLTGKDLLAIGATTLAEALDEIPELQVRQAGRGGIQVNIRGGRKGAIKVLLDGVPVDEVFYGTFDISSIPVTDIAQIRVSLSPSSPLDGVGGPGGVIEIHTIDAVGARMARLRANGSNLPAADVAATGRTELAKGIAVRGSITAALGMRDFTIDNDGENMSVAEDRHTITGALRVEARRARERLVIDAVTQQRGFVVPPGEEGLSDILVIDSESSSRFGLSGDIERRQWKLQGRAYVQTLDRESVRHADPTLADDGRRERVSGTRAGAGVVANHPIGKRIQLLASSTFDTETGTLETENSSTSGTSTVSTVAAGGQLDLGQVVLDSAAGLAIPLGAGDRPWPEAKLAATWAPARPLQLKLTVGRKGRLPTLRERFRTDIGNPDLAPEIASFVEVESRVRPHAAVELRSAAYVRDSDGMIRFDGSRAMLINVNNLIVRGLDSHVDVAVTPFAKVGATYAFTDSYSPTFGLDSLDFLPRHRLEGRVSGSLDRFTGRARVRHQSTQIDQNIIIPARTTVDFSLFARITSNLDAALRLDNALGERHLIRRGGVMSDGRVFTLTLQTSWQ